jgi:hypothetical protein
MAKFATSTTLRRVTTAPKKLIEVHYAHPQVADVA